MQGKASGRIVQQLQFFYLASFNYFLEIRISSVMILLAKINFLNWGRESLVPKPLSDLLYLCSWWQAAIFHDSKMMLVCETAQFNAFIWWPHTEEENVIIERKKNAVEEWILCLIECTLLKKCSPQSILKCFSFPTSPVYSFLASRSSYSGSAHNLAIVGVRASPAEKNAIWKGLLVLFCLIGFSFAFKYLIKTSSLLPFCLLVTLLTVTSERRIHVRTYWSILNFGIIMPNCNGLPGNFYNI